MSCFSTNQVKCLVIKLDYKDLAAVPILDRVLIACFSIVVTSSNSELR